MFGSFLPSYPCVLVLSLICSVWFCSSSRPATPSYICSLSHSWQLQPILPSAPVLPVPQQSVWHYYFVLLIWAEFKTFKTLTFTVTNWEISMTQGSSCHPGPYKLHLCHLVYQLFNFSFIKKHFCYWYKTNLYFFADSKKWDRLLKNHLQYI